LIRAPQIHPLQRSGSVFFAAAIVSRRSTMKVRTLVERGFSLLVFGGTLVLVFGGTLAALLHGGGGA
jgi:hypothetical protein